MHGFSFSASPPSNETGLVTGESSASAVKGPGRAGEEKSASASSVLLWMLMPMAGAIIVQDSPHC